MKQNKTGFYLLALSALAALMKGGQYTLLGRFLPLIIALIPTTVILILFFWPRPQAMWFGKIWAWMLIAWGVVRMTVTSIAKLSNTITENHVHEQSGLLGICLSICSVATGVYLLRKGFAYYPDRDSAAVSNP